LILNVLNDKFDTLQLHEYHQKIMLKACKRYVCGLFWCVMNFPLWSSFPLNTCCEVARKRLLRVVLIFFIFLQPFKELIGYNFQPYLNTCASCPTANSGRSENVLWFQGHSCRFSIAMLHLLFLTQLIAGTCASRFICCSNVSSIKRTLSNIL